MKSLMTRVVISLAAPIICFGCSTTDNWAIHPLYEHVEENSLQLQKILADTYRKDEIYRDYNTKMIAAGLFRSEEYRQFLIDSIQSSYQLDETASLEISLDQKQQFANERANLYKQIDIALDTFPYNGVTTTFEAISMGVPVITMKGYNFNSRCGESIIKNLGIDSLIASEEEDYISKAIKMANDRNKLSEMRKAIYNTSYQTPLFDTKKFSRDFFDILEKI